MNFSSCAFPFVRQAHQEVIHLPDEFISSIILLLKIRELNTGRRIGVRDLVNQESRILAKIVLMVFFRSIEGTHIFYINVYFPLGYLFFAETMALFRQAIDVRHDHSPLALGLDPNSLPVLSLARGNIGVSMLLPGNGQEIFEGEEVRIELDPQGLGGIEN